MINGEPKPVVRCLIAVVDGQGHVWGKIGHVRLEMIPLAIERGFTIVGPDPHDMIALATWEKNQALRGMP